MSQVFLWDYFLQYAMTWTGLDSVMNIDSGLQLASFLLGDAFIYNCAKKGEQLN